MSGWLLGLGWCLVGWADEPAGGPDGASAPDVEQAEEVTAVDTPGTASARSLDRAAIEALPGRSADELLRALPGLHLSAHGGRGKAYQYFLRGFDAVHGGDLAVSLEGVPLNERSNVHAHGYLDLQFLPTALVRRLDLSPGTSRPEVGDFAVAGSADFGLGLEEEGGALSLTVGSDRSALATLAWRPEGALPGSFVVAEGDLGGGVGSARGWRQARAGGGYEAAVGGATVRGWLLGYHGAFESPGVLRVEDVDDGTVSFYGAYPGSGGGSSSRVLGAVQAAGGGQVGWRVAAYGGWRKLSLVQNFTGSYLDELHGDGTAQRHEAWTVGAAAQVGWAPRQFVALRAGLATRIDGLEQRVDGVLPDGALWREGEPLAAVQASAGAWASLLLRPAWWLRLEPGVRGELFWVRRADGGRGWAPAIAPKLAIALFEGAVATGFVSYGRGYRSPDARGVVERGRAPLAVVDSFEAGLRAGPAPWVALRAAAFVTLVSDEIVFEHLTARYLATGTTRRLGVDGGLSFRPAPSLRLDADLTWSDGRYTVTREPVPYAPRVLGSLGLYAERLSVRAVVLTAGLRAWVLGPRPLPGGYVSTPSVVADLTAQVELHGCRLSLDVDNLFGSRWRDGEFVYASRWDPDGPRSELPARHFTAGAPLAVRLGVGWGF